MLRCGMPISLTRVDDGLGVLVEADGFLADAELGECFDRHFDEDVAEFARYRYWLGDYTQVTGTNVTPERLRLIGAGYCRQAEGRKTGFVAVAVSAPLHFGFARIVQGWTGAPFEWFITYSLDEAKAWLAERVRAEYGTDIRLESEAAPPLSELADGGPRRGGAAGGERIAD